MATKLYLRDTTANAGTHSINDLSSAMPGTDQLNNFGSRAVKDLSTTAGSSQKFLHNSTIANLNPQDGFWGKWLSDFLAVDITAQTWTLAGAFAESNGNTNGFFTYSIYVLKSDDTVRGFVYDNQTSLGGTEFLVDTTGTTFGGKVVTVSGSAVSGVVSTDRLCVEAWSIATQGMATSYFHDIAYDGATDPVHNTNTTDAASYVSTPQNGLFSAAATVTPPKPVVILQAVNRAANW